MIVHSKIGRRKVKACRFGLGKWFSLTLIGEFASAGKMRSNIIHLHKKSVINMI
jgi:hypothetical protein